VKIGLISDTHGSVKGFQKALDGPFRDVKMILHAGDVLYHGPRNPLADGYDTASLAGRMNSLRIPLMIARGNCDADVDQLALDAPLLSPYVFLHVDRQGILIIHGEHKNDADFENLIRRFNLAVLVHGHSHTPRIKKVAGSLIINPGTPAIPNPSSPFKKTAGVLDLAEGSARIWDIDTGEIVLEDAFDV
jgi:putative phosphoesterase